MAIIPIFYRNWWDDEVDRPFRASRLMDPHFGSAANDDDLLTALAAATGILQHRAHQQHQHRHHPLHRIHQNQQPGRYNRPWHSSCVATKRDSGSTVNVTNDKFQINLDVQQFSPEEISVKYVDKSVVVEGKHEEKQDEHGYISRHFVRRYMLPNGHNENDIVSSLSSDGILTITCPKKEIEKKEERAIPITHTGQPMKKLEGGLSAKESQQT
ncbi:protein lethal(2)essential for life-like [Anopheles ziemanni]|uniref:protein lethal(2)essential for life-like n=1 Tax=Anopheles coustani TaxID=139045 RepID=UPI002659E811|nr:protein lethal(2)essential for life-like [Anopheles coustani]XP_058178599.1 protein lethal(2)essential for life-like [Anopheles ziemanni]